MNETSQRNNRQRNSCGQRNNGKTTVALRAAAALWVLLWGSPVAVQSQQNAAAPSQAARRLTLPQAVELALRNNREILQGQAAVSLAAAEHNQARSVFYPQVFTGSGLAATKGFPLSIEGSAPSIFQVSSSQALFDPSLRNLEKQAGRMQESAARNLDQKRDDVVAVTAATYLDLDRSRRSLEYARGQTENLSEAGRIMEERVRAGLEPALESAKARLDTARARSQQVALETQIAMLEFRLRDLTGMEQSESIATEAAEVPLLASDETVERLIRRALENSPGLQALEEEVRAREFQVRSEEATRWPRVNLVGQYGLFSKINNYEEYFQRFARHNATFGISVVVPVYQREQYSARLGKAEAELAMARYRRDQARAGVAGQVQEQWNQAQQQAAAREVARLELEVARRTLDAVLAQYEEGKVSRLAVEQARVEENRGWVSLFETEYQEEKARLELLRLTGEIRSAFR